jgi:hypothetical protein
MEFGLSVPYARTAVEGRPILNLSWFTGRLHPIPGFAEYGFVAMLPVGGEEDRSSARPRITDFAGMYAGHLFVPFQGRVRPGFNMGWIWEGKTDSSVPGAIHSSRFLSLYYAFKLQYSCLTFQASNKGIGGGLNFSL